MNETYNANAHFIEQIDRVDVYDKAFEKKWRTRERVEKETDITRTHIRTLKISLRRLVNSLEAVNSSIYRNNTRFNEMSRNRKLAKRSFYFQNV